MKTKKEWLLEAAYGDPSLADLIEHIQLDAWKQGMTDAAWLAERWNLGKHAADNIAIVRDEKQSI